MGDENNNNQNVVQSTQTQQQVQPQVVVVSAPAANNDNGKPESSVNTAKLFSQDELNAIVQSRVNNLNQKITDLNGQLAKATADASAYKAQLEGFAQKEQAVKLGIKSEFVDFAIFNANKLAVDGKTFEVALGEYAAANKALLGIPDVQDNNNQNSSPNSNNVTPAQQKVLSTNLGVGNNGGQNNSVDSQVADFLKKHGLKK